jgi:tetratricopeptide (TPR) repeat protein
MPSNRPLCFVLMPFGNKKDPSGGLDIDFDDIYESAIRAGIEDADMDPLRADEERTGGIIHKAMFERLLLCDFAVADLTTANANVFYELGVRHATRPATTLPIFAARQNIPFDVNALRALPYELGERNRLDSAEASKLRGTLARRLRELRSLALESAPTDSPLFQLLDGYAAPEIARLKTDAFRDQVRYAAETKRALAAARDARDVSALKAIEEGFGGNLDGVEAGVLVDLFLSYRAVRAWEEMIRLYRRLPVALQKSVMLREQLGFALNRAGRSGEAISVLQEVLAERGASSETCGILGRVYKDLWTKASREGQRFQAEGYLGEAVDMYVRGFEADSRDAYPGINAVTLLDIKGDPDSVRHEKELLPVVRFAVALRLKGAKPDYWDHATMLELAVLGNEESEAQRRLSNVLVSVREPWEPESTANNLKLIRDARRERGASQPWLDTVIDELTRAAQSR